MNWFDKLREIFLEDNRYMWMVEGLGNTLLITLGALVIGVIIGALMLLVLSPVLLGIALCVKLSSPGPILFKQERIGRFGRPFNIYKFRSRLSR